MMYDRTKPATAYGKSQAEVYDAKRFMSASGARIHQIEFAVLREALQQLAPTARVLEVGCGTGRLLLDAAAAGYPVDGTDGSPEMLDMLRSKAAERGVQVNLEQSDASKLPYPSTTYDLAYAIRLLNQTESPEYALRVVREMVRVVKPGGYILVEFVNGRRPRWGLNKRQTTRLLPAEVVREGAANGAGLAHYRGAFFLGMQVINATPKPLLGVVCAIDRLLSLLLPRLCSRCYVLLRKKGVVT